MKKIILYKFGRWQEDFEYVYRNVKVVKYVTDEKERTTFNDKKCIYVKDLNTKLKHMIVICSERNKYTINILTKQGLKEDIHYTFLEDYVKTLDEKIPLKVAKVIEEFKDKYKIDLSYKGLSNSEMFIKMMYTEPIYNLNCTSPFTYAQVQPNGEVFPCVPGKSNESIGNIYHESPKSVWNSIRARMFRLSIINKTYAFCNLDNCNLSDSDYKRDRERAYEPKLPKVPEQLVVAFDETCNLKCKSCRKCVIDNNNDKVRSSVNKTISNKLSKANWINKTKSLLIGSQGEPFFSKTYQDILFKTKLNGIEKISIHTNGLLFTPKVADKLYDKFKKTDIGINISLDSLDSNVYKKIRDNSDLSILKENLQYISKMKKEKKFKWICLIVILQRENYKEIPEIVKFAIDLGFDSIDISKINNWGIFDDEEFKELTMYNEDGTPKQELTKILKNPIFQTKKIQFIGNVIKGN